MKWHDCKNNPPKKGGEYLLCYKINDRVCDWDKVVYCLSTNEWLDSGVYIVYGERNMYYSNLIPYMWAEVEIPEVE